MRNYNDKVSGFTIVEVLVTIVVGLIFLISIFSLNGTIASLSITGAQTSTASNLAYTNMRQYVNGEPPTWYNCSLYGAGPVILLNTTSSTSINNLPPPVTQNIYAYAPFGCGDAYVGLPIKVESYVTFGAGNRKVTHASFVSY